MNQPLLERRSPLGISYALLVLMAFFFFMPSAFRAARLSLGKKENDVKDWLPKDFPETAELSWFTDHFIGESFVLATWPGCTSGDTRLTLLADKLRHESESYDRSNEIPAELRATYTRAREVGNELQLLQSGDDHLNWGGKNEKWLCSASGQWYYITPDGRLFRWDEASNGPAAAVRSLQKSLDKYELQGQFVAAFGDEPGAKIANPFYNDPSLICAPLFRSVETGDSIVSELASEDGALWPVDLTEENRREVVARRRAMQRLTGTLFAPAVPKDFEWTPSAFRQVVQETGQAIPEDFDLEVNETITSIVESQFDGSVQGLQNASTEQQTDAWYAVFDAAKVEPPPRLTCVLLTLTRTAHDNLHYALGRGVLGGPRGRLLQLAEQSGLAAAPSPSLAPPPFNVDPVVATGIPPLRLGGPPVDNVAIDEEGSITLVRLVGYSMLLGVVLSFLCFRSIKITVMVFIVGGSAAMLSMAMVWWTNGRVDAILMSMPSLVYVLGLSGAIHVVNYYRDEVRAKGREGAAGRALRHAMLPCTLASLTTAIGLISLFSSNLAPISNFGLYSAIGVIATLAILFSYLPAALETFAPHSDEQTDPQGQPSGASVGEPQESFLSDAWAAVGGWITRHHGLVSAVCLVVLLACAIGLVKIKTSVQLLKLFDPGSRIIEDYAWLEDNFGKLVPMELVVRVPPALQSEREGNQPASNVPPLQILERVEVVSRVGRVVRRTLGEQGMGVVGQSTGADTFLPPLPDPSNGYAPLRSKFNRELLDARDEILASDYLRIEQDGPYAGSELWRVSLRVGALSDVDYGHFISTLRTAVEPVMRAYDTRDALMRKLASDEAGNPMKVSGKDRVLVVGCAKPEMLDDVELFSTEGEINVENIYLSTLGELLSGERIRSPGWFDPNDTNSSLQVGSEKWDQIIAKFDAVIWVGGEGTSLENFAAAAKFVDARKIADKIVQPALIDGKYPEVQGADSLQVIYTGAIPVVYKAQRTLLASLGNSIGLAFVLIAAVMIMLLNPGRFPFSFLRPRNAANGFAAGFVSMVPNVFPVLLVFGCLCHLDIEIDIGTMMTASVAMGVAVDDTIHFLSWFRSYLDRGMSRVDAVIETYRRVGPAMTQTTIVGGLGLFVFALSTFTPTQRFGTLMLILLGAALVGDLVMLPALLAGPLGRFFKPREGSQTEGAGQDPQSIATQEPSSSADNDLGDQPDQVETDAPAACSQDEDEDRPVLRLHAPPPKTRSRKVR